MQDKKLIFKGSLKEMLKAVSYKGPDWGCGESYGNSYGYGDGYGSRYPEEKLEKFKIKFTFYFLDAGAEVHSE